FFFWPLLPPSFRKKIILDLCSICQIFLIKTPCIKDTQRLLKRIIEFGIAIPLNLESFNTYALGNKLNGYLMR
ncbi:hypothetical protein NEOC65_001016, partial [Neochlamydia sp. AcF65]|nr:hypothetical protein [Neochlamydia sp. AcF65]